MSIPFRHPAYRLWLATAILTATHSSTLLAQSKQIDTEFDTEFDTAGSAIESTSGNALPIQSIRFADRLREQDSFDGMDLLSARADAPLDPSVELDLDGDAFVGDLPVGAATPIGESVSTGSEFPIDGVFPIDGEFPIDGVLPIDGEIPVVSQPVEELIAAPEGVVSAETLPPVSGIEIAPDRNVRFGDWLGYNTSKSQTTWLADRDFGGFSVESFPTLDLGSEWALTFGTGFHFLQGPIQPDVNPRLFDLQMAYHMRHRFSSRMMLDLKTGVGAFSDFEGSARKGVRFPGHAVLYSEIDSRRVGVFGVEVLDRDDISLLPVIGCVWLPRNDLVLELVFPRPKVHLQTSHNRAFYVGGELGGGTWAIERPVVGSDNMTYRDLRVTCGVMQYGETANSVLEFGVAFDRHLEFRSGAASDPLGTAFLLRCHTHY